MRRAREHGVNEKPEGQSELCAHGRRLLCSRARAHAALQEWTTMRVLVLGDERTRVGHGPKEDLLHNCVAAVLAALDERRGEGVAVALEEPK